MLNLVVCILIKFSDSLPLLLYLRNPRAKPFMFGFYNQRFL